MIDRGPRPAKVRPEVARRDHTRFTARRHSVTLPRMNSLRWTPERMNKLEHAAREGLRVAVSRRGNEFVVVARRIVTRDNRDTFIGYLPITGEEVGFALDEIDAFEVLGGSA